MPSTGGSALFADEGCADGAPAASSGKGRWSRSRQSCAEQPLGDHFGSPELPAQRRNQQQQPRLAEPGRLLGGGAQGGMVATREALPPRPPGRPSNGGGAAEPIQQLSAPSLGQQQRPPSPSASREGLAATAQELRLSNSLAEHVDARLVALLGRRLELPSDRDGGLDTSVPQVSDMSAKEVLERHSRHLEEVSAEMRARQAAEDLYFGGSSGDVAERREHVASQAEALSVVLSSPSQPGTPLRSCSGASTPRLAPCAPQLPTQ